MENWLDLSTGINPDTFPIPPIDPLAWQRLPEDNDGLEEAAAAYYGSERLLVLPGSQAAIQSLPLLFKPMVVACVSPLYEEHPHAWEKAGHKLRRLPSPARYLSSRRPCCCATRIIRRPAGRRVRHCLMPPTSCAGVVALADRRRSFCRC